MSNSLRPHEPQHNRPPCASPTAGVHSNPCPLSRWCYPTIYPLLSPSPHALNLSQYQGFFQWVSSSHQVAKVLEFQLQHKTAKWKKKKKWKQYKRHIGLLKPWQYTHNGDPERRRKGKGDWKGIWRNYGWKLAKPKEGNRDLGRGNSEGPKEYRPKQNYTKI